MRNRSSIHAYVRSASFWPTVTRFTPGGRAPVSSAGTTVMPSRLPGRQGRVEAAALAAGAKLGREGVRDGLAEVVVRVVARAEHVVPRVARAGERLGLAVSGDAAEVRAERGDGDEILVVDVLAHELVLGLVLERLGGRLRARREARAQALAFRLRLDDDAREHVGARLALRAPDERRAEVLGREVLGPDGLAQEVLEPRRDGLQLLLGDEVRERVVLREAGVEPRRARVAAVLVPVEVRDLRAVDGFEIHDLPDEDAVLDRDG